MTRMRIAAAALAFGLSVAAAQAGEAPPEGDREYDATCATMAGIVAGIDPSAYPWSPIVLDRETVVSINPDDPLMVTVICTAAPRIACMETYNPDKTVGDAVRMEGRVRYVDRKMILLDPCHSVPAE